MIKSEEVFQIGWAFVVDRFVGQEEYFEGDAVIYTKPVELSEDWCHMVMFFGFCDQFCCRILHSLQLGCKDRW